MFKLSLFFCFLISLSCAGKYPRYWWKDVSKDDLAWWEIAPQDAGPGEVILSKRNELGLLSNFAKTPFYFYGKRYSNLEALWQSMKYPENNNDIRAKKAKWPYLRSEVEKMDAFSAKKAGDLATKIMKKMGVNYVTFNNVKLIYWTELKGEHYHLIRYAMLTKLLQNKEVQKVLKRTKGLILLPDHLTKSSDPPAWKYNEIWMEIRDQLF